jgi:ElaB/YqjD/DUF883 family membrane-anchored ribosome-binding protein
MQSESDTAKPVGAELLSDAKTIGTSAANRLHSELDARKNEAVTQVQAVSSTIERAAEALDDNAPSWLKSALDEGAQHVQSFADTLDENDSRQIVAHVSEFAKQSPGTFLGACAAIGFAAARVFKAGSNDNKPTQIGSVSPVSSMTPTSSGAAPIGNALNPSASHGELL